MYAGNMQQLLRCLIPLSHLLLATAVGQHQGYVGQVLSHLLLQRRADLPHTDEVKVVKVLHDFLHGQEQRMHWAGAEDASGGLNAAEETHVHRSSSDAQQRLLPCTSRKAHQVKGSLQPTWNRRVDIDSRGHCSVILRPGVRVMRQETALNLYKVVLFGVYATAKPDHAVRQQKALRHCKPSSIQRTSQSKH